MNNSTKIYILECTIYLIGIIILGIVLATLLDLYEHGLEDWCEAFHSYAEASEEYKREKGACPK